MSDTPAAPVNLLGNLGHNPHATETRLRHYREQTIRQLYMALGAAARAQDYELMNRIDMVIGNVPVDSSPRAEWERGLTIAHGLLLTIEHEDSSFTETRVMIETLVADLAKANV